MLTPSGGCFPRGRRAKVDDGHFNHRVATRTLLHRGTGGTHQHLTGEGRIVDAHVKLEQLILRRSAHTLARKVHTVTHVDNLVDTGHQVHVRFVRSKVRIGLDGSSTVARS